MYQVMNMNSFTGTSSYRHTPLQRQIKKDKGVQQRHTRHAVVNRDKRRRDIDKGQHNHVLRDHKRLRYTINTFSTQS